MYIPLYNKTNYTLLSSLLKIDDLILYAQKNNINSIAINDNNMYGTQEFIKKCQSNNIKPIIGLTVVLDDYKIIFLAKNYQGYKTLLKLSTIQNERVITNKDIDTYHNEVISILPYEYNNQYKDLSKQLDDLYLGYSNKKEELEVSVITEKIVFFKENLYLNKEDEYFLPYLYRIRDSKTITDDISYETSNKELDITNINELTDNKGLLNTLKIADSCNIEFPNYELLLPLYDCDDPSKYLFELSKKGLSKRLGGKVPENYKERLSYELKIINDMGFPNYFLVVYDFIKYAKKNNILVGPGRGSAAGSLVAYCLGITRSEERRVG